MNPKQIYFLFIAVVLVLTNCTTTNKDSIARTEDYNRYLEVKENKSKERAEQNINFWFDKLEKDPNQFPYHGKLASAYSDYYVATGNITYIKKAEDHLIIVNEKTKYKVPGYLKRLAHNYITQHKFKAALGLLKQAEQLGENLQETRKMLFDVHLELGNYEQAHSYLKTIENFSDFDYLIRLSKWSDHKGQLDIAINYMEKALDVAESSNLAHLKQWSYTNLADFYGHAGKVEKSYQHYLKALMLDPNDAYAKKGIAWIVYSHENDPVEALRIMNAITDTYHAPDYQLLTKEIAEHSGFDAIAEKAMNTYTLEMKNSAYGDMYNKYNVLLFSEDNERLKDAILIAKKEIANRPTPQSYDLLAWAYFKSGSIEEAVTIIEQHVVDKTSEPETLYHVAEIYKAAGKFDDVKPLKKELLASLYELGPTMNDKINQL